MDRVIAQKRWSTKRLLTIAGIAGLVLLISGAVYFSSGKSRLNVDTERISISEIKKGPFQEFIPVNGIVLPQTTIYLDALEGGRVEEKYVEDGDLKITQYEDYNSHNTERLDVEGMKKLLLKLEFVRALTQGQYIDPEA